MFKKIWNFFIAVFSPDKLIDEGGETFREKVLRPLATNRPKLFKLLVVSNYAAAKLYGTDLVASTATNLDDKGLAEYIESLELIATENGIDLAAIDFDDDAVLPEIAPA